MCKIRGLCFEHLIGAHTKQVFAKYVSVRNVSVKPERNVRIILIERLYGIIFN